MARKANFDKQEKLQVAMELFWRKGYANTSISDLVEELGINRFSLYNTYGDKQALYYLALDNYLTSVSFPSLDALRSPEASWQDIKAFLDKFAAKQRDSSHGCFVQNAIVEHASNDNYVFQQGNVLFETISTLLKQAFNTAQNKAEIREQPTANALASMTLTHMQGIRVLGKAKRFQDLDDSLQALFTLIENEKPKQ